MRKSYQVLYSILLFPSFVEGIDASFPTVSFGPFTLGRFLFILSGITLLIGQKKLVFRNSKIFYGLFVVLLAILFAGLLFGEASAVYRTIANILLLIGARGVVYYLNSDFGRKALALFFIACLAYWLVYFVRVTFIGGALGVYSELFYSGTAVNHHIIGMLVSVSSVYVACLFFMKEGKLNRRGYLTILVAAVVCLATESRSNTLFTILSIFVLLGIQNQLRLITAMRLIPIILIGIFVVNYLLDQSDVLSQRFDLSDTDYQERTTGVRGEMFELGFVELFENPLGKGLMNVEVIINGKTHLVHNQYLSFIIGGGFLGLIGVIVWLSGVIGTLRKIAKTRLRSIKYNVTLVGSIMAVFVFHATLVTIEFSSLLFYIIMAVGMNAELNVNTLLKSERAKYASKSIT